MTVSDSGSSCQYGAPDVSGAGLRSVLQHNEVQGGLSRTPAVR